MIRSLPIRIKRNANWTRKTEY